MRRRPSGSTTEEEDDSSSAQSSPASENGEKKNNTVKIPRPIRTTQSNGDKKGHDANGQAPESDPVWKLSPVSGTPMDKDMMDLRITAQDLSPADTMEPRRRRRQIRNPWTSSPLTLAILATS